MRSRNAGWLVVMGVDCAFELGGVKRTGARNVCCLDALYDSLRATAGACKTEEILGYGRCGRGNGHVQQTRWRTESSWSGVISVPLVCYLLGCDGFCLRLEEMKMAEIDTEAVIYPWNEF